MLASFGGGVQSGSGGAPSNVSRQLPSCSQCHSNSAPTPTRTNGPTVTLTAGKRALQPNEQITITTAATGGVSGTTGGFVCEATRGVFTAGSNSQVMGGTSITHTNRNSRSWTYTFTAPAQTGRIELTAVAQTTNGSGSSNDQFAFAGYDNNATVATPVRLFVLPQGVQNRGNACPDGYGNQSVLGAGGVPTVGSTSFGFELHGATPNTLAFLFAGFNPVNFTQIDLGALFGLTGCYSYVASPISTQSGFTSAGVAQRAEGEVSFPMPLPNNPALRGLVVDFQAAYIDPTAVSMLSRAHPLSFANGLKVTIQ